MIEIVPLPKTGMALADHIMFDHEREIVNVSVRELRTVHAEMHRLGYHWDHAHKATTLPDDV